MCVCTVVGAAMLVMQHPGTYKVSVVASAGLPNLDGYQHAEDAVVALFAYRRLQSEAELRCAWLRMNEPSWLSVCACVDGCACV